MSMLSVLTPKPLQFFLDIYQSSISVAPFLSLPFSLFKKRLKQPPYLAITGLRST